MVCAESAERLEVVEGGVVVVAVAGGRWQGAGGRWQCLFLPHYKEVAHTHMPWLTSLPCVEVMCVLEAKGIRAATGTAGLPPAVSLLAY